MKNILFSPIGLTDPISNFRDGAMLNICRFYDIDKVYIYLSKEVYDYQEHDYRYTYCLNKLGELRGKPIEYELIIKKDLTNVHIFDYFIDEFRHITKEIHDKNPEDRLYINVSSGTPAMKSSLQILAAFREFDMIPIQVSTPEKRSNPHAEEKVDYRPKEMWECNEDNIEPENRCQVSKNINFLLNLKKQMLIELIDKYDYVGAKTLADTMKNSLCEEFLELLEGSCKRLKMEVSNANLIYKKYGHKILSVEQSNYANIAEYFLYLKLKVQKEEYGDFLRGISPLLVTIFEEILERHCGISVREYTFYDKNEIRKWDMKKLKNNCNIMSAFDSKYENGFKGGYVKSDHFIALINYLTNNEKVVMICNQLRSIEENLRNKAAHVIISITDEWIYKKIGFNSETIISKINEALTYTNVKTGIGFFESYDKMNEMLINALKK